VPILKPYQAVLVNLARRRKRRALRLRQFFSMRMQKGRRKRHAESARALICDGGFVVEVDGEAVETPAGRLVILPTRQLAEAVAQEWVRPDLLAIDDMPLTRLANGAIDGVMERSAEVVDAIVQYAASDLICYRAPYPPELAEKQAAAWDPILDWFAHRFLMNFRIASGIGFVEQPAATLDALRTMLADFGPIRLAALQAMTTLTGSALLTLAHVEGRLALDDCWRAAHIDEDWQMSHWGEDHEAALRRERRFADMAAASRFFRLAGGS
jgi:chaperone required for assembly of F1-ATPase